MKSETLTLAAEGLRSSEAAAGPVLVVVEHPEVRRIGDRLSLEPGKALAIGRRTPEFGPEPLGDARISTTHVDVRTDGDRLSVADQGSKNGVFVAGADGAATRVDQASLEPGAFVQIGSTILRYLIEAPFPLERDSELVGVSLAMHRLRAAIDVTRLHDRPVLVTGSTGAGKELVARDIHRRSGKRGSFVALNCSTLSRDLAEAELFGHTKGAYTGADRERPGLFRSAVGGTVFLDEIGTLPIELQPKLLRVLQEKAVRPVGASREEQVDVRVVAATNENLSEKVSAGAFREDLYSRLLGGRVIVPSLDERREDIVLLGRALLARAGHADVRFSEALAWRLLQNAWPLNVRSLEQILLAAAPLARNGVLDVTREIAELLDEQNALAAREPTDRAPTPPDHGETPGARSYTRKPTREDLVARLEHVGGNVAKLADAYGVRRQQIYRWAEALGVDLSAYR
jgi:transcriptional regulator with GAF, ATPase, and Fis domain